jgi:hypothetical protein
MAKQQRARPGDVFAFDIDDGRVAAGQLILKKANKLLHVVIFRPLWAKDGALDANKIAASEILFVGGTLDARLWHGDWRLIGNVEPDLSRVPLPFYKSRRSGRDYVLDFQGNAIREADSDDLRFYHSEWFVSPMVFEDAVKAYHGLGPEPRDIMRLTYEDAMAQSRRSPV